MDMQLYDGYSLVGQIEMDMQLYDGYSLVGQIEMDTCSYMMVIVW